MSATPGDTLQAGASPVEINSRPLIALTLPFDLFRDLTPGLEGSDVSAVQASLQELGMYDGAIDGVFGAKTSAAVRSLYAGAGARAPEPPPGALEALDAATAALAEAQAARTDQADEGPVDDSTSSDRAVAGARVALARAQAAADTPLPFSEVLSLPTGATTVVDVAGLGTDVSEQTLLTIRSGSATVTARASVSAADQLEAGDPATITDAADTQVAVTATVTSASEFKPASTDGGSPPGYDVTLALTESPFADGALVVVTPAEAAASTTGPAVPATALRQDEQGEYVERAGGRERVAVKVLATGGGWAVVESSALDIGDVVLVSG
ncbi:peptidoglycan-binding domain-containing protein [Cellulomonas sp. SLBN-39]|uniref:peptidoglycan-binding domain-containing protein n=1 Tax=Cellulomonas sp. SLBN-39 TaxID=2768446 RepID=UPI00135B01EA|nr:peptidoglycan-binding domain-containing protein [Cellulomonas sp. SLBN-39]